MPSATQKIGNYRLLKHLGDGGQASVYLGEHLFLKRRSAIKILHTSLDEQNSAVFLSEAQILASLSHPHIIRVHDFTIEQGEPLLVMDYASGGTLRSFYPAGQPIPLDMLLTYLKQIASALQYAHDRGIIHRDIKPENLLLDDQLQVKLSDFGLALLAPSPEQLKTQELIGTVFYMAPEQLRGNPVSPATSIRWVFSSMNGFVAYIRSRVPLYRLLASTLLLRCPHFTKNVRISHGTSKKSCAAR